MPKVGGVKAGLPYRQLTGWAVLHFMTYDDGIDYVKELKGKKGPWEWVGASIIGPSPICPQGGVAYTVFFSYYARGAARIDVIKGLLSSRKHAAVSCVYVSDPVDKPTPFWE